MATITKISDDKFGGKHPNKIDTGYSKTLDIMPMEPVVGYSYRFGGLMTSNVTEVISSKDGEIIFKTLNSTYKVTF